MKSAFKQFRKWSQWALILERHLWCLMWSVDDKLNEPKSILDLHLMCVRFIFYLRKMSSASFKYTFFNGVQWLVYITYVYILCLIHLSILGCTVHCTNTIFLRRCHLFISMLLKSTFYSFLSL